MGIKLGTVVVCIIAVFLAKISLETTLDGSKSGRAPASIDEGYDIEMNGNYHAKVTH